MSDEEKTLVERLELAHKLAVKQSSGEEGYSEREYVQNALRDAIAFIQPQGSEPVLEETPEKVGKKFRVVIETQSGERLERVVKRGDIFLYRDELNGEMITSVTLDGEKMNVNGVKFSSAFPFLKGAQYEFTLPPKE